MGKIANYQISLKCFLKNSKGETLILKTPDNSSFNGMYDFVGGRIDEDEFNIDYIDILKREIFEETGLKDFTINNKVVAISRHKPLKKYTTSGNDEIIQYIFFEGIINSYNIFLSKEHIDYKWVNLEKIKLEDYFCSGYLDAAKMHLN